MQYLSLNPKLRGNVCFLKFSFIVYASKQGINIVNWRGLELLQHPQESSKQDMDSVPLTAEAIAFTEKKMDMTLEDIIKMSKKKGPAGKKAPRQQVKKRPFQNGNSNQGKAKVQRFHESRSSIRQGVLAQRRSNLDANQFQITKQAANKAATMPVNNGSFIAYDKVAFKDPLNNLTCTFGSIG
ncbi:hypothetical protein TRIUR3_19001 [Triticum urartu]|uniref:Uncharacterized protein n=2 Tax=Triticum TaxID=4564 RepID=A0A9R0Y4T4_TRITD|nr:hypothetical protein TRIUR3_19001 [Triticum urartu]VAI48769.1 unnamed protein product [Triticum turgidum subsp. durum]